MPKLNGNDKTQLPRGLKSTRAEYGVRGAFLGVPKKIWVKGIEHQVFVLPGEIKSHVLLVPQWCREEVFQQLHATWSWSKHLAEKVIFDAVTSGTKIALWHHGIVTPASCAGKITGIYEEHAERIPKVKPPAELAPAHREMTIPLVVVVPQTVERFRL